jgi:hypothetical protein
MASASVLTLQQLLLGAPSMLFALLFLNRETLPKKLLQRSGLPDGAQSHKSRIAKLRGALSVSAIRPLRFLFTEPITTVLCIWISFAWGCLYLFLQSVPLVFAQHGFRDEYGTTGLAFVGLAIGAVLGFLAYVFSTRRWPMQKTHAPEARLREACVGGVLFAAGERQPLRLPRAATTDRPCCASILLLRVDDAAAPAVDRAAARLGAAHGRPLPLLRLHLSVLRRHLRQLHKLGTCGAVLFA